MTATSGTTAWGMRYPGFVMGAGGENQVQEFTGMWPLRADADLEELTTTLTPGGWEPADMTFTQATTKLGLIRTARWIVCKTHDPGEVEGSSGYSLFFITQFDGSLAKYLDDFVLNGKRNLAKVWGGCVGCPTGPEATAQDIVGYIARGQIKTLACYDAFPSQSIGQIYKTADWYEKTKRFQRAVARGDGNLEDVVNAFIQELSQPYTEVPSDAAIDPDVGRQWQFDDVVDYLLH